MYGDCVAGGNVFEIRPCGFGGIGPTGGFAGIRSGYRADLPADIRTGMMPCMAVVFSDAYVFEIRPCGFWGIGPTGGFAGGHSGRHDGVYGGCVAGGNTFEIRPCAPFGWVCIHIHDGCIIV